MDVEQKKIYSYQTFLSELLLEELRYHCKGLKQKRSSSTHSSSSNPPLKVTLRRSCSDINSLKTNIELLCYQEGWREQPEPAGSSGKASSRRKETTGELFTKPACSRARAAVAVDSRGGEEEEGRRKEKRNNTKQINTQRKLHGTILISFIT